MSPRITIDAARPIPAPKRPAPAVDHGPAPKRAIGLGVDLTNAPAMPRKTHPAVILAGLGCAFFALGLGLTLALARPAALESRAPGAAAPGDVVARNVAILDAPEARADAEPLTGSIALTREQQASIAAVLALAKGETPAPVQATRARHHVVAPGETLADIALKHYGDVAARHAILSANADVIRDPDLLTIGRILTLPPL